MADALLGGFGVASSSSGNFDFIDFYDVGGGGATGNFANDLAFPNDAVGNDDDFCCQSDGLRKHPNRG